MTFMTVNTASNPALMTVTGVDFPPDATARIAHWVRQKPDAIALLHKRWGLWGAYRWSDLPRTLTSLRDRLTAQGLGPQARLAVSGAFEPQLILMALAAHGSGATVIAIDRHAQGRNLLAALQAAAPTHALVQNRATVSAWLESGYVNEAPQPLYCAQAVAHGTDSWSLTLLTPIFDEIARQAEPARRRYDLRQRNSGVFWLDEGTEWADGLAQIVAAWLESGAALAAPETGASSSTRDRREVQPRHLLASPARQRQLQDEWQARLAPAGSWRRRLMDHATDPTGSTGPFATWLRRRITRLHGLPLPPEIGSVPGDRHALTGGPVT